MHWNKSTCQIYWSKPSLTRFCWSCISSTTMC